MQDLAGRIGKAVGGLIAIGVLILGTQTAVASASPPNPCLEVPSPPGWIGTCPPYDAEGCRTDCQDLYGSYGNDCIGGCCICGIKAS